MQQKYALLSVFDKTGIVDFAKQLQKLEYKIISTGGTAKTLQDNGVKIIPIQEITGNPESFDGRMKTISFQIESGILFDRTNQSHIQQAEELRITPIDIVVCNLYPFEQTVAKPGVSLDVAVENIDVGGPTMIRAAAKNFKSVLVLVDPKDYETVGNVLRHSGETELAEGDSRIDSGSPLSGTRMTELRKSLAAKAFAHLSFYDSQIATYLETNLFPQEISIPGRKIFDLRYGENPHQQASFYSQPNTNSPLPNLKKLWGRELSLVNLTDINAGLNGVKMFDTPSAVVIKHNNPCGIALGKTPQEALQRAIESDPESAFGGVIVINQVIDKKTAEIIAAFKDEKRGNIDILAAPQVTPDALSFLSTVRKSMGIYVFGDIAKLQNPYDIKFVTGGFILQTADNIAEGFQEWKVVTNKKPTEKQMEQMQLAWKFISKIRSNAIIVVDKTHPMTRGIGTGQTSRIRSTKLALEQAGTLATGAILASDSFFPFDDGVKMAAEHGISAIVQQGGSINDQASIDAANKAGIAMVFTNRRSFWH